MGILSDFFISAPSEMASYGEAESFPDQDRCEYKYITPLEAGGVLAALLGSGNSLEAMGGFQLQTPGDAETWTMIVPDQMRDALLSLEDSSIPVVATRCGETIDSLDYSQSEYEMLLADLRKLAQRAVETKKQMYLWNCL